VFPPSPEAHKDPGIENEIAAPADQISTCQRPSRFPILFRARACKGCLDSRLSFCPSLA